MPRYAIYYAPPAGSALWRFGSGVIGYDAETGEELAPPAGMPASSEIWRDWTAEPRRYGFHATLKAPFELAAGRGEAELLAEARTFAGRTSPVRLPGLAVAALGRFVALVPARPVASLTDLAWASVLHFESLRAPLGAADRARRVASPLTERQAAQLDRYGYPYVGEDFRFHLTLTGPLPEDTREPVRDALAAAAREVALETEIDEIAVFRQADRAARFRILARFALTG